MPLLRHWLREVSASLDARPCEQYSVCPKRKVPYEQFVDPLLALFPSLREAWYAIPLRLGGTSPHYHLDG